ncbi:transporter substrate-binding domain-containing protein [Aliikangiella maris]|uniref:Transporter substrate-binding domain-containing protein n=2 Tax=Aliikangiella maris TaxID=3162458 RepID=A0ABV3MSV1_9GAMM
MKSCFTVVVFCLLFSSKSTIAQEVIEWGYFHYPPVFNVDKKTSKVTGYGFELLNLVIQQIPEYQHHLTKMPLARMVQTMRAGKNICAYGMFKTKAREKHILFSLPSRIGLQNSLVILKNNLHRFPQERPLSFEVLLQDPTLIYVTKKYVSYGVVIDDIFEKYRNNKNIITLHSIGLGRQGIQMLLAKRVDYMLYDESALFEIEKLNARDKVVLLPIAELGKNKKQDIKTASITLEQIEAQKFDVQDFEVGHFVCTKNNWGKKAIARINQVLLDELTNDTFFSLITQGVPANSVDNLKSLYQGLILTPANLP